MKSNRFISVLKKTLKYSTFIIGVILLLFSIASYIIFEQKKEWLLAQLKEYINQAQSGQIEIADMELKLLKHFPKVTVALDSIKYYEHRDTVRMPDEQPILNAKQLFVALDFWSLINKEMKVSEITLSEASLNMIQYEDGLLNLENALTKRKKTKSETSVVIELKEIHFDNIFLNWNSSSMPKPSEFFIQELDATLFSDANKLDCKLASVQEVRALYLNNPQEPITGDVELDLDFTFNKESSVLTVRKSQLEYNAISAEIQGIYSHRNNRAIDLAFDASSSDVEIISLLIQEEVIKLNPELIKKGGIYLRGKVFGELKKAKPQVDVSFGVKDLTLRLPNRSGEFRNLGFEGNFKSGSYADYSEAKLEIKKLRGNVPGGSLKGTFEIKNFVKPYLRYNLILNAQLDGYDNVFHVKFLKSLKGSIALKATFDGLLDFTDLHTMDSSRTSTLTLDNVSFVLPKSNKNISGLSGTIVGKDNQFLFNNIKFKYDSSDFQLNASIGNLMYYILNKESHLEIASTLQSDRLFFQDFRTDTLDIDSGRINDLRLDFRATAEMKKRGTDEGMSDFTLTLNEMSFLLPTFKKKISNVSGTLSNKGNQFSIADLKLNYNKSDLRINATITNLLDLLSKGKNSSTIAATIQSNEIVTQDFIWNGARTALVQDRVHDLRLDFTAATTASIVTRTKWLPDFEFEIKGLSAKLDKLSDLKRVTTKGNLIRTSDGLKLTLNDFQATMSQGKVDIDGDVLFKSKSELDITAKVMLDKFPWDYINDLVAEIDSDGEPSAKKSSVNELDLMTADLTLAATLQPYPFAIKNLVVDHSRVNYRSSDARFIDVQDFSLDVKDLYFLHPPNSGSITGLKSMTSKVEISKASFLKIRAMDLILDLRCVTENQLNLDFSMSGHTAKQEKGNFLFDFAKEDNEYTLSYIVQDLSVEPLLKRYVDKKWMTGNLDFDLQLISKGPTWNTVKDNLSGTIKMTGDSLLLYGLDVDAMLTKYEKSQKFNLVDLGAFMVAGPVGPVLTKGSDFAQLMTINLDTAQRTPIQSFHGHLKLGNGQLSSEDVGFATTQNRIAFDGKIDLKHDTIPGITIAVVDKNGCSLMDQRVYGKTSKLKAGKLNVTKTLLGPVINFANAVVGNDCKPVYKGKVKHPSKK
ncbi:MAG: AsmA-like C-terminal region-containing protein [Bacteroidota bacterium]